MKNSWRAFETSRFVIPLNASVLTAFLCAALVRLQGQVIVEQFTPESWRQKLEAEWQTDAELRSAPERAKSVTTQSDAGGGCDGIKDGKWGFHTGYDPNPWWEVDLGQTQNIGRVLIWNRCDQVAPRARKLTVLLSDDGKQWRKIYSHSGATFFGFTDRKPLEIRVTDSAARFIRIQIPGNEPLHLDEVEVFDAIQPDKNLALHCPANQSSTSQWSQTHLRKAEPDWPARVRETLAGCDWLVKQLGGGAGVNAGSQAEILWQLKTRFAATPLEKVGRSFYFEARSLQRKLALANLLLNFDKVLFSKRVPGSYSHMSDQFYGWWSRPGGGIYVLENFKSDAPRVVCLTPNMPVGSFLRPDLSFDGKKVLFAFCKYHPEVAPDPNKTDKAHLPEDAFYHVFEMNVDGSGLRQLTHGRYDDFDARYLPNGEIVFLSTRRGTAIQANKHCATKTLVQDALPDSFVRCGGDDRRPVSVYTLHVMDASGGNLRAISPFENFEWTPSIASDGRIFYSRWDYVDRDNMPFMSLWATTPDGANPQLVYGNVTRNPYGVFEARSIPNSQKIIFTASAHHSIAGGSLVLFDPLQGREDTAPLRRLTPEVCFPETEGWPETWYVGPYPLSEDFYLTGWSNKQLAHENQTNARDGLGIYLYDSFGNRDLLYRDGEISSMDPLPLRPRQAPAVLASNIEWDGQQEGRFLLVNVYDGLEGVRPGEVKSLRIVAVPAKTQPQRNKPVIGVTTDDPGKCVLGTVPVEADGSAYFRAPSGVNVFFQALDAEGFAIQTMRTVTYVQPNQTLSCVGCHESRNVTPRNAYPLAVLREPSKIAPGPEGSWPLRFDRLVQPVLDARCVSCHDADAKNDLAANFDLTTRAYDKLVTFGKPSLKEHIMKRYYDGRSVAGEGEAKNSALLAYLRTDRAHAEVKLSREDLTRLTTWMDTYAQKLGSFSNEQERELRRFRESVAFLLEQ
jgi:hypothetical protein